MVRAARSAVLSCFLDFAAILFSRFLLHRRVCLSSLVALPRNSSFATISLKTQLPWVPEAFHARFPVTVKSSADEAPRRTRKKTSGTQSNDWTENAQILSMRCEPIHIA